MYTQHLLAYNCHMLSR